ncbi:MAG: hypothetical protein AAF415_14575 [Pseudomonadota bacterium]
MTHDLRAFGLNIRSDMPIEGFMPGHGAPPDVAILLGDQANAQVVEGGTPFWQMRPAPAGGWVFRAEDLGDYWIREGREIHLSPAPGAEPAHLQLFLIGSALGMLLHQRGQLALHSATCAIEDRAIAFVGAQQAGKSTHAATMAGAGHAVLGDDTMPVWLGEPPHVWPGAMRLKLWRETLEALALEPGAQVSNRLAKHFSTNPRGAEDKAHPLGAVVLLDYAEGPVAAEPIAPLPAIDLIAEHSFRPEYVPLLDRQQEHFKACATLANAVPVWRLTRPRDLARRDETVAYLQSHWRRLCNHAD